MKQECEQLTFFFLPSFLFFLFFDVVQRPSSLPEHAFCPSFKKPPERRRSTAAAAAVHEQKSVRPYSDKLIISRKERASSAFMSAL